MLKIERFGLLCLLGLAPTAALADTFTPSATDSFSSSPSIPNGTTDFGTSASAGYILAIDTDTTGGNTTLSNGVTFTGTNSLTLAPSGVAPGYSITYTAPAVFGETTFAANNLTPQSTDANVSKLLQGFYYPNGGGAENVAITGLLNGVTYTVTFYDSPFGPNATPGRLIDVTGSGGATGSYQENTGAALSSLSYTAIAANNQISFSAVADDGVDGFHIYGFTVVPEPASLGLLAISAMGLCARRRTR